MKCFSQVLLLLLACSALPASAASFGIKFSARWIAHPVASFHTTHAQRITLLATDVGLQLVNSIDYATTRRGAFPGTGGCEKNILFTSEPCQIDVPRFTGAKIGVAAVGAAEWIPVALHRATPTYFRTMQVVNVIMGIAFTYSDVNNVIQLEKH
jgi:hypothetical protein